jgi:hypothetical protein
MQQTGFCLAIVILTRQKRVLKFFFKEYFKILFKRISLHSQNKGSGWLKGRSLIQKKARSSRG